MSPFHPFSNRFFSLFFSRFAIGIGFYLLACKASFQNPIVVNYDDIPFQLVVQKDKEERVYQSKSILREIREEEEEVGELRPRDVLDVLSRYSLENNPPLRFLSTNGTDEVIQVEDWKNTWTSRWKVYLEDKPIDPELLHRGIKMKPKEKIRLVYMDTKAQ